VKRYHTKRVVSLGVGFVFSCLLVSCGQSAPPPSPTATPLPTIAATATVTLTPPRPTATAVAAASTPTPAAVNVAPTQAAQLKTENFEFTVPVSEDDLGPIIPAILNLDGVTDAVGGGNGLQVTYDASKLSHKQIADIMAGYGFHVKE
jgi:hypothetical protein